jgi:polysaccharide biosynthesis protein PslJ
MSATAAAVAGRSSARVVILCGALALLAVAVVSGSFARPAAVIVVLATLVAIARTFSIGWSQLLAGLILIILFVPIRRYALPAGLPFQLELYRVFVVILIVGWGASLLVDSRTHVRKTGFEGPLAVILGGAIASILANPGAVAASSSEVNKSLMFFLSFVLVFYLTASAIRRLDEVDHLAKTLVAGGAIVALFAIIEARTGFNIFNHLSKVMPFLIDQGDVGGFQRVGTAKLRVFGSAQHPIALSAALVMLIPLALYLARRYRQRRWTLCALMLVAACAATVSRTGIVMLAVAGLVFLWLRPRETRRLWPALLLAPIVIHFALPGTLGAIKNSFMPAGGLLAEQKVQPGTGGSGRLADLGPGIQQWKRKPLLGEGYGTRVVDAGFTGRPVPQGPGLDPNARILDDQWLGTLIETGIVGFFGWLWFFARAIRRFGREAKQDESERGWLLASITAAIAAYAVGMVTYDAFAFIQVTFLMFILVALGAALLAERPTPLALRTVSGAGAKP